MTESERVIIAKNGIKIYFYRNPALHSFHTSLFIKAGIIYENLSVVGITHFLEHVAIRNVNRLYGDDLYRLLDSCGLEFNASTYSEMVQFYIGGSSGKFATGADIIAKILSGIVLTSSDTDAERKRIKAELHENDDRTSLTGFSNRAVFFGTTLASSIVGTNSSVDKITVSKLEAYRKSIMTPENMFFYVTGNFTDGDIAYLISKIEDADTEHANARSNEAQVPSDFLARDGKVRIKNADYPTVRFTFDIDMTKYSVAETDLLYDVLLSGYSSSLFVELSEKRGLVYDISGAVERYKNIGTLYFTYETKLLNLYESIRIVVDILNSMKLSGGIDADIVKSGYVDNAEMLYDDSRELNFTFAYDNHIMDERYASIEERKKRYENISSDRLSEIAADVFRVKNLTLTMKAPKKKIFEEKINSMIGELL